MLKHELLRNRSLLIVTPESPLEAEDFTELNHEIDAYLETTEKLKGLMISAASFPGWETFEAFLSHMKFIKNQHKKIVRVAVVTDTDFLAFLPRIASYFVQAEIRHFAWDAREIAMNWLESNDG